MAITCKKCRRLGTSVCGREKCAYRKKPYPPGVHGKGSKRSRRGLSDFGKQLREKQTLKFMYGLREKQFRNYVLEGLGSKDAAAQEKIIQFLESRLDNAVFRCGFAPTRSAARQLVSHGHIVINGKKVNIPSYRVRKGEKIALREQSASKGVFKDLDIILKKYQPPQWLKLSKPKRECEVVGVPSVEEAGVNVNINAIIEFYSR